MELDLEMNVEVDVEVEVEVDVELHVKPFRNACSSIETCLYGSIYTYSKIFKRG